jgi:hypothetical protein
MDYLKDLLPSWYKQNPALTTIAIFAFCNGLALVTCLGIKQAAQERKPETPAQIQINGPITAETCSAAGIGQAKDVSIQCDDKTAAQNGRKESEQHK